MINHEQIGTKILADLQPVMEELYDVYGLDHLLNASCFFLSRGICFTEGLTDEERQAKLVKLKEVLDTYYMAWMADKIDKVDKV